MQKLTKFAYIVVLFSCAEVIFADGLEISNLWSRAVPMGAKMGAVYGIFSNTSDKDITVTKLHSSVSKMSEVHQSIEQDGMMRMRHIAPFIISANSTRELAPGGLHIMLMGLSQPIKKGMYFQLEVVDESGHITKQRVIVGGFGQLEMPTKHE